LGVLIVGEWVANCTGCGAKGEYNPEKTGKSLSKHIINGKICGLFNITPKQLASGVTAASEIAACGRAIAAASTTTGAHINVLHTYNFDSPVFVDSI
jgi:hypothetical protein